MDGTSRYWPLCPGGQCSWEQPRTTGSVEGKQCNIEEDKTSLHNVSISDDICVFSDSGRPSYSNSFAGTTSVPVDQAYLWVCVSWDVCPATASAQGSYLFPPQWTLYINVPRVENCHFCMVICQQGAFNRDINIQLESKSINLLLARKQTPTAPYLEQTPSCNQTLALICSKRLAKRHTNWKTDSHEDPVWIQFRFSIALKNIDYLQPQIENHKFYYTYS